jgi:hypothetical protein
MYGQGRESLPNASAALGQALSMRFASLPCHQGPKLRGNCLAGMERLQHSFALTACRRRCCLLSGYFTLMSLGTGGSWDDVRQKIRQDFWPTLLAELAVWPPIQAANFKLVASPNHQLLVVNLVTVLGVWRDSKHIVGILEGAQHSRWH